MSRHRHIYGAPPTCTIPCSDDGIEFESHLGQIESESSSEAGDTDSPLASNAPHLPIEVCQLILEALPPLSQRAAARSARICSALRYPAEASLYRSPRLYSFATAETFAQTVSQCARRAGAVRRLAIGSWRDDAGGRSRDIKGVGASLERLPLLDSVELLDKASLKYVELLVRHRHVQLKCIHGEPLRATKDTIAFLRAHPELEEISLSTTSVWSRRFAGLRLANIRVLSCRGSIVRAVAFAETFPNLTSLDVRQISPENVYRLIATVGDRLVSLRIEQHVRASVEQPGRMYPTSGYDWRRCARLRHLEMSHRPEWSNDVMRYFTNDPIDAENLPPALEELVWSPAWTRIYTSHVYPDERKRGDLRRFAEAVLRASPTLRLVGYEWVGGQICSCWLASQGLGLRENLDEGYSSRSRACNG